MKMDASAGETIFFCMFECPTIIISSNNVNLEISTLCELVTVALNSKNWKMKIFSPVYNVQGMHMKIEFSMQKINKTNINFRIYGIIIIIG